MGGILKVRMPSGEVVDIPAIVGQPGYTPQKGIDYWTEADKTEIKDYVDKSIEDIVDLTEYVKNTDYATSTIGGVVKVTNYANGLYVDANGKLGVYGAESNQVKGKATAGVPITPLYMDYGVSLATHQEMSDEYDVNTLVSTNLMAGKHGQLPVSYDAVKGYVGTKADKHQINYEEYTGLLTLYHNTESRLGEMDIIVLSIPSNFSDDYTSSFSFKSGETATSLIYPSTPVVWRGDDCDEEGEFIPEANTSYEVSVKYLGDDSEGNPVVVARVGAF